MLMMSGAQQLAALRARVADLEERLAARDARLEVAVSQLAARDAQLEAAQARLAELAPSGQEFVHIVEAAVFG